MLSWQMIRDQSFTRASRGRGNPAGNRKLYVREIGAFDIETTTIYTREIIRSLPDRTEVDLRPHAIMYVWMYAIDDTVYYGRTWDEFKSFISLLEDRLPAGYTLLTYVHNLSFEYTFLSGIFDIPRENIFPILPRKILKVDLTPRIEMRCSYLLSNRPLRKFLQEEGVSAQKGEMDYKVKRYPWTPLGDELKYCENDVLGLTQAIRHRLKMTGDTVYTIPYTQTGYVRREAKRALRSDSRHDRYRYDSWNVFVRLARAFRGGNTHASRYWVSLGVVNADVYGDDFSSFYPSEIESLYPDKPFFEVPPAVYFNRDHEKYIDELIERNHSVLMTITFTNIEVDECQHVPYIPFDHCEGCIGAAIDNGRVIRADSLTMTFTDIDLEIIRGMYSYEGFEIKYVAYSGYSQLPQSYIDLTREYFRRKTALKASDPYEYAQSKTKLNALYGFMAMSPLRKDIEFDDDGILEMRDPEDPVSAYAKGCRKAILPYSAAVWLTARCRAKLQKAIDLCGDDFLYCDTDSVKHLTFDLGHATLFKGSDFVAYDAKGLPHRMGVLERDSHYSAFVSLGAKKYAVRYADDQGDKSGKLEITVAGVGKEEGSKELEEAGGLEAFKKGFRFRNGGIDAVYNDTDCFSFVIGKHHLEVTKNVALVEGVYTLGLSPAYSNLLDEIYKDTERIDPFKLRITQ